jgi:thiol-disulfide isomerase/thioredoxin
MGRRWAAAVAAFAVLVGLAGCEAGVPVTPDTFRVFGPAQREAAPDLFGELLDGGGTYAPTVHAGKVVVINFWASWCAPCVSEAPELEAVYAAHKDGGVAFLGINVRDERDSARAFARQHTTYPSIVDTSSRLVLGFAVHPNAIPSTIVLDRQGRVAAVKYAAVIQTELEPVVTMLLEEAT